MKISLFYKILLQIVEDIEGEENKMARQLDFENGIWTVALVQDASGYFAAPVINTGQGVLMNKLEEIAESTRALKIVHVYDFTDSQGFEETREAARRLGRGEPVDLEAIPHRHAAPKMWTHYIGEFNRKYAGGLE
jgi:hypothetical protein